MALRIKERSVFKNLKVNLSFVLMALRIKEKGVII